MFNSYDEYCDSMGPDKLKIKPEIITKVIDVIRELLLQGGDDGFEDEDLEGSVTDWEVSDEDPEKAIVSIELFDDGRDDGITGYYSREFTFTEYGIVSRVRRLRP